MVFCEVKFDNNPNGVHYSGQTLSGVVEITNEKRRKVKALTLRIEGYAKVNFSTHVDRVSANIKFDILF